MARFANPILFSHYFKIDPDTLDQAGLIDPFLNVDLELFIDPILLQKSSNPEIAEDAHKQFCKHFASFIKLLSLSKKVDDAPWKGAKKLLDLSEPPENGLGYGGSSRSGSSRPEEIRLAIMRTATEIIEAGSVSPEMVSLMGFFEEGVGPDTISDFTTRVIFKNLAKITSDFCDSVNLEPRTAFEGSSSIRLPVYEDARGKHNLYILVPKDIVRDLPIANDWSDVRDAVMANSKIRDTVNLFLAGIIEPTLSETKEALKKAVLSSAAIFQFLETIKDNTENYDPIKDTLGYYHYRNMLISELEKTIPRSRHDLSKGPIEIKKIVLEAIDLFKRHIEVGDLWRELWVDGRPKKERAAQLMFQAVADAYCKANDIDMSPEANMGGGPVDFKFSVGYKARVLVEIKRDSGTVRHGYETQLEHYKEASDSFYGIFVVIDFGNMGGKLEEINKIRNERIANGEMASDIIVIDAQPKKSASKK